MQIDCYVDTKLPISKHNTHRCISCIMPCTRTVFKENCNSDAPFKLLTDIFANAVKSLPKLMLDDDDSMPRECTEAINGKLFVLTICY